MEGSKKLAVEEGNNPHIPDPRAEAMKYLDEHKIRTLFEILGAKIARVQPENPNDFLVEELTKIYAAKNSGKPVTLFTRDDIDTMFSTFDLTGKGYVSQLQFRKALMAVGIEDSAKVPREEKIDRNTFVSEIYNEVIRRAF